MDVQSEEALAVILRQAGYIGGHQDASVLLIKSDFTRQVWSFMPAPDICHSIRTGSTWTHHTTPDNICAAGGMGDDRIAATKKATGLL